MYSKNRNTDHCQCSNNPHYTLHYACCCHNPSLDLDRMYLHAEYRWQIIIPNTNTIRTSHYITQHNKFSCNKNRASITYLGRSLDLDFHDPPSSAVDSVALLVPRVQIWIRKHIKMTKSYTISVTTYLKQQLNFFFYILCLFQLLHLFLAQCLFHVTPLTVDSMGLFNYNLTFQKSFNRQTQIHIILWPIDTVWTDTLVILTTKISRSTRGLNYRTHRGPNKSRIFATRVCLHFQWVGLKYIKTNLRTHLSTGS